MQERNLIWKEKLADRCRRQDKNSEYYDSAQHLGKRRAWFFSLFRLSRNDRRQRNSQLATDGLTPFDLGQTFPHLALKRDPNLRTGLRIFAQHVHEQVTQRPRRMAQLRQAT